MIPISAPANNRSWARVNTAVYVNWCTGSNTLEALRLRGFRPPLPTLSSHETQTLSCQQGGHLHQLHLHCMGTVYDPSNFYSTLAVPRGIPRAAVTVLGIPLGTARNDSSPYRVNSP